MSSPDLGTIIQFIIILVLLVLSAFFSSAETALTRVNKIRIQMLAESGDKRAAMVIKILDQSPKMLSTILIGNNIVNIFVSSLVTTFTIDVFGNTYVGLATGILTLVVLIFGEITPKNMASLHAEKISLRYAGIIYYLMNLLTPVVFIINKMARAVMRIMGIDPDSRPDGMTEEELRTIVNVSQEEGVIEREEKQMIYNVFDFGDSTARDVMVPRADMASIDVESSRDELMDLFRENKHTRLPVYEDSPDNIIGIINMKDLLLVPDHHSFSLKKILREPYFTYEHKATADLLVEMRKASVNLAIVLDEYGSTAGLVTLEDLLEEIVGEIRDEYDADEKEELQEIEPGREYIVQATMKLYDLNEKLHLNLESEEYDSIGGYFIQKMDRLPKEGQSIEDDDRKIRFVADKVDKKRIEQIHIWFMEPFITEGQRDDGPAANDKKSEARPGREGASAQEAS